MPHQALLQSNHCRKKLRQSLIRTAGFGESHRKGDEDMVKIHEKMVAFLSAVCEEQGTKHGCHCCQGADKHRKVLNKNPRDSPRCAEKCCRCAECTTFFLFGGVLLVIIRGSWTQAPESPKSVFLMVFAGEVGNSIAATWGAFATWSREISTISSPKFVDFYDSFCFSG